VAVGGEMVRKRRISPAAPERHALQGVFVSRFSPGGPGSETTIAIGATKAKSLDAAMKDRFEILSHAARLAPAEGLVLEFGVAGGATINYLAELPELRERRIFGFDSFCGLPERWGPYAKGHFAQKRPPAVVCNVELVIGFFAETLPVFLALHPGPPGQQREHPGNVSLVHCDADLYASTKTVLELLTDRIVPGTIIVFDEYYVEPDHEQRAFREWLAAHGLSCRHLARTDEQLVVVMK
jgi:predicted O-methyltransferase YrrM